MERTNKGAAWAYLKRTIIDNLGEAAGSVVLAHYYDLLHQEYKERQSIKAADELIDLRARLSHMRGAGRVADIRKVERMIAAREKLIAGKGD